MSSSSCCCCSSHCCRRQSENKPLILPPYTQAQKRTYSSFQSHKRQQQTLRKIKELVKNKEEIREKAKAEHEQSRFTVVFRRKYVDMMSMRLSSLDKSKLPSTSTDIPSEIETDLDRVIKNAQAAHANEAGRLTPPTERFALKHGRASMEGRLLKFTNLMKGYRYRWVVLNDEEGTLQYYETKESKRSPPKGCMFLGSAKVSTKKGELTFTVSSASGEIFKLKAYDAREKQLWIDRIRAATEYHTRKLAEPQKCTRGAIASVVSGCDGSFCTPSTAKKGSAVKHILLSDSYINAKENFREADDFFKHLDSKILELPTSGMYLNSLDARACMSFILSGLLSEKFDTPSEEDPNLEGRPTVPNLLLLKAMSAATLQGVQDCIYLLHVATEKNHEVCIASVDKDILGAVRAEYKSQNVALRPSQYLMPSILDASVWSLPNPADEVPDNTLFEDNEADRMDDHKTIIIHLLSQLKLGMDLTKVVLPTFVLEKRSLLELFTDCMAHPDLFLKITSLRDPEARFLAVMEWYLLSFHSGRLGTSAKKPYNPIIGETFHCSWHVPVSNAKDILLTYTAEQVSHHPPVTAFYVECPEKRLKMNSSIYTKSKFMGMSMGVSLIGKVQLHMENPEEDYVFSLPSAYARSILTVPWVELGDKIQMTCESTGYAATIVFHTKPFIGGKLHHVSAEAKNQKTGKVICKVAGEWNATFQFTYPGSGNETKTIDVNTLKVYLKHVRPLEKQKEYESRRLWHDVTEALSKHDMQKATEFKVNLENIQREEEQRRRELKVEYEAKFFRNVNGVWLYKTLPDSFALEAKK